MSASMTLLAFQPSMRVASSAAGHFTPFCVTVDFDTLEDQAVTDRERDSMAQERIPLAGTHAWLVARLPAH